jgi:hypothetical protein
MMGSQGHGAFDQAAAGTGNSASPWSSNAGGGELSRQAGVDDIGRSAGRDDAGSGSDSRHGLFDTASNDTDHDSDADDLDAGDGGFDSGGDGGSDLA